MVKPTREDFRGRQEPAVRADAALCFSLGDQHRERVIVRPQPGQPLTEPCAGNPRESPVLNPVGVPLR